jgi:hypothetical protein
MKNIIVLLVILLVSSTVAAAVRFSSQGPVLTVTLKDPDVAVVPSSSASVEEELNGRIEETPPWFDFSALNPNALWGIQTQGKPLPNRLPSLQSLRAAVGYRYADLRNLPSWIEGTATFEVAGGTAEVRVQPSYEVGSGTSNLLVQVSRGAAHALARFVHQRPGDKSENNNDSSSSSRWLGLQDVRASTLFHLPTASLASIRVSPSVNVPARNVACRVEAVTGGSGRTKAVLNLEASNPTLAVLYAPTDKHLLRPEISLTTAAMTYQWIVKPMPGCTVKTLVDPMSHIAITWTDESMAGTGTWQTDVTLPLAGTAPGALAAKVRVRRQFRM